VNAWQGVWIAAGLAVLIGPAGLAQPPGESDPAGPDADRTPLDAGPMVGHVTDRSAAVWAYAPRHDRLAAELWRAGPNPQRRDRVTLRPDDGDRRVFRHVFTDLEPATTYHYRLTAVGRAPRVGGFTTAPAAGRPARFRYLITSCMNARQWPVQPAWDAAFEQQPAFHLLVGDNVYADTTDYDTLWTHHLEQRAIPNFAHLLARVPSYATWDDHDFGPNDAHALTPGKERSLAAFKALWANPGYGTPDTPGVFYAFAWADVDFFVLDNRYYRTDEHADVPNKTQFGDAQLRWLADGLTASTATFKIVVTGYDVMGARYPDEVGKIATILRQSEASGVVFHAGDIHRNEFKQQDHGAGYPITQITSSGIARSPERPWVTIDIDTTAQDPTLTARFFTRETLDQTHTLRLSDLTAE
jgi:alkaline phosphatase D